MASPKLQRFVAQTKGKARDITPFPSENGENGTFVRINKRMAELGLCSRREADTWLLQGRVRVNGQVAQLGQGVTTGDVIELDAAAQQQQSQQVTLVLHKPIGYVSAQAEDGYEAAIKLITKNNQWHDSQGFSDKKQLKDAVNNVFKPNMLKNIAVAGRLDIDSTGLLVFTQDGRIARALIGENSEIEKEYLVRVHYRPMHNADTLKNTTNTWVTHNVQAAFPQKNLQLLRQGLFLDGKPLKKAQVEWQNPEQLRFVLKEGKKRQIRRMCEQVGLHVVGLKRVRTGRVMLGNLPVGKWRFLLPHERF